MSKTFRKSPSADSEFRMVEKKLKGIVYEIM